MASRKSGTIMSCSGGERLSSIFKDFAGGSAAGRREGDVKLAQWG